MRTLLIVFSFALSGFLSGGMITLSEQANGNAVYYAGGLFFGLTFVLVNFHILQKMWKMGMALLISTGAYYIAVFLIARCGLETCLGALTGSVLMGGAYAVLFRMKFWLVFTAIVLGGALGVLMYVTDIDDGFDMARTYTIWHGVVGTLLSLALVRTARENAA